MNANLYIEFIDAQTGHTVMAGPFTFAQVALGDLLVGVPEDEAEDKTVHLAGFVDGYWYFPDDIDFEQSFTHFTISTTP